MMRGFTLTFCQDMRMSFILRSTFPARCSVGERGKGRDELRRLRLWGRVGPAGSTMNWRAPRSPRVSPWWGSRIARRAPERRQAVCRGDAPAGGADLEAVGAASGVPPRSRRRVRAGPKIGCRAQTPRRRLTPPRATSASRGPQRPPAQHRPSPRRNQGGSNQLVANVFT